MASRDVPAHVALLAFPFGTHAAPLHALARGLAAACPGAAFSFLGSAGSNAALPRGDGDGPPNLRLYDVPDGCPAGFAADPRNPEGEIELFMGVTPGNFREGMAGAVRDRGGARITCLVSDAFLCFAGDLAAEMGTGVPWVALWTGGPRSLSAHLYTDDLRCRVGAGHQVVAAKAEKDLGFLPGMSGVRVRDLPEGVVSGNLDSVFARLLHRMGQELPRAASAVALNTFEGLDPGVVDDFRAKFSACPLVGPLNLLCPAPEKTPETDPCGCTRWLDRQAPGSVAYVSFGTVISPPPGELRELAEGLEASGAPFLWSLREGARAHLPEGFLERTAGVGLVVGWAPQRRVLAHPAVGAFVTHCGWNSVMESLAEGVPMVCRPFLGDQRLNARAAATLWGIAVGFDGGEMTRGGVAGALDAVLRTPEGRGMRERAGALGEAARGAVRPQGSSAEGLRVLAKMVARVSVESAPAARAACVNVFNKLS